MAFSQVASQPCYRTGIAPRQGCGALARFARIHQHNSTVFHQNCAASTLRKRSLRQTVTCALSKLPDETSASRTLYCKLNPRTLKHEPGTVWGATLLVAGTTAGAGILALPAVTQVRFSVHSSPTHYGTQVAYKSASRVWEYCRELCTVVCPVVHAPSLHATGLGIRCHISGVGWMLCVCHGYGSAHCRGELVTAAANLATRRGLPQSAGARLPELHASVRHRAAG